MYVLSSDLEHVSDDPRSVSSGTLSACLCKTFIASYDGFTFTQSTLLPTNVTEGVNL